LLTSKADSFNFRDTPPIVLEMLVYHTALNSTFSLKIMAADLPYTYIDEILWYLSDDDHILGVSPKKLSMVYKISFLRRDTIDGTLDREKEEELEKSLLASLESEKYATEAKGDVTVADELFDCASSILLAKILNQELRSLDPAIQTHVARVMRIIEGWRRSDGDLLDLPLSITWPISILGFVASGADETVLFLRPLTDLYKLSRSGSLVSILVALEVVQNRALDPALS
jgi:hypothetical protein